MFKKSSALVVIAGAMAVLALGATACGNLPISLAQLTNTPTPTMTPTPAPQAVATPAAPQGKAPQRANAAQALQALLKGLGLTGGVITSNDGSALGLKLGKATQQLQVASDAIIVVPGKSNATLSDFQVGDRVVAHLASTASNAPAAFVLAIPAAYTADNVLLGAVMPGKNAALDLRTPRGARNVTTSAATTVVNLTGEPPAVGALGDLQPANAVLVIGQASGSAFDAQAIVVLDKDARTLLRKVNPKNAPTATPTPGA